MRRRPRAWRVKAEWIAECAADLLANKGECVVVAGSHLPDGVHAVAYALNEFLGNVGKTVDFISIPWHSRSIGAAESSWSRNNRRARFVAAWCPPQSSWKPS